MQQTLTLYGGSPFALNYAQWLRFMHAVYRYSGRYLASPTDQLLRRGELNADSLSAGWPAIDFAAPDAPALRA